MSPDPSEASPGPSSAGAIRWFACDDASWGAWLAGEGVGGTGRLAIFATEAVHFCREEAPGVPVREALLARGRFPGLYDSELCALLRSATDIVALDAPPRETPRR